jgi:hypothetical protein
MTITDAPAESLEDDYLLLKWGSIKDWHLTDPKCQEIIGQWIASGVCVSAMGQRDTPEQKRLICDLIEAFSGPITNDWTGEEMTKDSAKKYVLEYRL